MYEGGSGGSATVDVRGGPISDEALGADHWADGCSGPLSRNARPLLLSTLMSPAAPSPSAGRLHSVNS